METIQILIFAVPHILFYPEFYLAAWVVFLLILSTLVLSYALKKLTNSMLDIPEVEFVKTIKKIPVLQRVLLAATVSNEEDVLLDHNYDGIMELDNSMPSWWVKLFYVTIITAIIYMLNFHVFRSGKLQNEEYAQELQIAEQEKEAYRKTMANNVDEKTVIQMMAIAELQEGKNLFIQKCSPCHGKNAEGLVGPNLTDDYWLHGGGIKNVFKTIKYGVPLKGMIAWETQLNPTDIQKIASYILSLKGSNPVNPKAPQGELYKEEIMTNDSVGANK
jgi:cytochrome c oxidase cbb3-type subunit 3